VIVATAGHIDHGKTRLIGALTGVDTDRLPEEKARGISIDLGFAYLPLERGGLIGFVDVPGHERFVHNMLAGVCGIDFALLAVAADDGVMPQTVEHLQILDLLGVARGIAAITKIDRADARRVAEVEAALRGLLAGTTLAGCALMRLSAATGEGIAALRAALVRAAEAHRTRFAEGQHFRLAVDRAFSVAGSGTIATGTVFNGAVRPGDRLIVSPGGVPVRVRAIQVRGEAATQACAGERCALNLAGIDVGALARGDWVLHEALHAPTQRIDVRLKLLTGERAALRHWTPVHLHLGTAEVMARVAMRRGESLAPGAAGRAQLVLERPIAALGGDRFIVRDRAAGRTLGGGAVIDPFAPARRWNSPLRLAALSALETDAPEKALEALLRIPGYALDCARFETTFNLQPDRARALYRATDATLLGRERRFALAGAAAAALGGSVAARLERFHRAEPQAPGIDIDTLRAELAAWLPAQAFGSLLRGLAEARAIEIDGVTVRRPEFDATANPADEALWRAVEPALVEAHFAPPTARELARRLPMDEAALRDFLHRKSRSGALLRVGEDRFYLRATLAVLAANAALVARYASRGLFTAAQYRDAIGTNRGLAIEILELLDALGVTQRIGDARKMHRDFVPILGAAKPAVVKTPVPAGKRGRGPAGRVGS
jgi:selenocysteine-specific elongation factor